MSDPYEPMLNGEPACDFIKRAYGLMPGQTPRRSAVCCGSLRSKRIRDWVNMAQADAMHEDPTRG